MSTSLPKQANWEDMATNIKQKLRGMGAELRWG